MQLNLMKKVFKTTLRISSIMLVMYLVSCEKEDINKEPASKIESIIEVGLDPEFESAESDNTGARTNGDAVILDRVRIKMSREINAAGKLWFKIRRVSDGKLMATSGKIDITRIVIDNGAFNYTNVSVNLRSVTKILETGLTYRIEVHTDQMPDLSIDPVSQQLYWLAHRENVYPNGCSGATNPRGEFLDCEGDFTFETINREVSSDGTITPIQDQLQAQYNVNVILTVFGYSSPDLGYAWQEFVPGS